MPPFALEQSKAIEIYRLSCLIRQVEEEIAARYHEGKMRCPTHLSIGQEAVAAAAGVALRKTDLAVSTHRAHAHYLGKAGSLKAMIAEIYGKAAGCSQGRGGSMHLIDLSVGFMGSTAIVGNSIPLGVGLGLSLQLQKKDDIAVVFIGDAAVEEGVFYEAANFAVVKKLPILFICENNLYSVYSPLSVRQPKGRRIHKIAVAIGLRSEDGDGNDALACYEKISASAQRIRNNQQSGPEFLEFYTYRWREHCGPNYDNDIGYRSEEEFLEWKACDPLEIMKAKLLADFSLTEGESRNIEEQCQQEIHEAFAFAEKSPWPLVSQAFTDEYSSTDPRKNT